jgi:hypothetical protein
VQIRALVGAAAAALACSACANDPAPLLLGKQAHASPLTTGTTARDDLPPLHKTMASKVLTAIALERVTGRKPDPARLAELN